MLENSLRAIKETFSDMAQNEISIFVVAILSIIILSLIIAIFSEHFRRTLVKIRFLEKDESPKSLLIWILGIIIAVKLFQAFVLQPFIVDGTSMLPSFKDNEFLLVDKVGYKFNPPERGDVVVFKLYESESSPYGGRYLIKRIIGLPGDRVVVKNGVTTIYNSEWKDGFTIDESFVTYSDPSKNADIRLKDEEYFVMGDNRRVSYDSRIWGALKAEQIRGRALVRVFPFEVFSVYPGKYSYDK